MRNLLFNNQVRVVIIDGPTGGVVGEETRTALERLWHKGEGVLSLLGPDVAPYAVLVRDGVTLIDAKEIRVDGRSDGTVMSIMYHDARRSFPVGTEYLRDVDRPNTAVRLPPPPPKASAPAPHGDPGERVAGDTLADVWPLALQTVMRFGREVPTHYGMTREFLNLVSVVRDPVKSLEEIHAYANDRFGKRATTEATTDSGHPILGFTYATVEKYTHDQLIGSVVPEGQSYGYGSRMTGNDGWWAEATGVASTIPNRVQVGMGRCKQCRAETREAAVVAVTRRIESEYNKCPKCGHGYTREIVDQFAAVKKLLTVSPDTRAAYLTPWRAEEDSGKESGRPCLVGVMFRAVARGPIPGATEAAERLAEGPARSIWQDTPEGIIGMNTKAAPMLAKLAERQGVLHVTVTFRSHDLHGAYPLNLAGCCLWLVEWARDLGMAVGTLTCLSVSAHVYDRDWAKAAKTIEMAPKAAIKWDQRSVWRVETYDVETPGWACPECGEWYPSTIEEARCGRIGSTVERKESTPKVGRIPNLRAIALAADGQGSTVADGKPIAVIEAPTPGALRLAIERSGMLTEIGGSLWLGSEIERVWSTK